MKTIIKSTMQPIIRLYTYKLYKLERFLTCGGMSVNRFLRKDLYKC